MSQVSVIIPTYKHRDFVLATLDSVFAQTFTDYEVIVVNDGSPDDTADLLRPLVERGRIRYIEQDNQGQAAARNRGIAEAQGEFIALLDDDDLWPPDKLEWQVELLVAKPEAVLVYGYSEFFRGAESFRYPNEDAPGGDVLQDFAEVNWITSPGATLLRAEALRRVGGFDSTIWGADDWDLYIRLAEQGRFEYKNVAALHYRIHQGNASKDVMRMYTNVKRVYRKHFHHTTHPKSVKRWLAGPALMRGIYVQQSNDTALQLMHQEQWKEACRQWVSSIRIHPLSLRQSYIFRGLVKAFVLQCCVGTKTGH